MQPNMTRQDSWINCHESTEVKSAWGKRSGEQRSWVRGSTTLECARGATSFSEVNHLKYNRVSAAELSFRNISPLNIKKPTNLWLKIQNLEYELKAPAWTNPDLPSELTLHCSLPGPFTQPSSADRRAFAVSVSLSGTSCPAHPTARSLTYFRGPLDVTPLTRPSLAILFQWQDPPTWSCYALFSFFLFPKHLSPSQDCIHEIHTFWSYVFIESRLLWLHDPQGQGVWCVLFTDVSPSTWKRACHKAGAPQTSVE